MGAEAVVDYALRFKVEFGRGTWVCGYRDDMIAYIPSRRVWAELNVTFLGSQRIMPDAQHLTHLIHRRGGRGNGRSPRSRCSVAR